MLLSRELRQVLRYRDYEFPDAEFEEWEDPANRKVTIYCWIGKTDALGHFVRKRVGRAELHEEEFQRAMADYRHDDELIELALGAYRAAYRNARGPEPTTLRLQRRRPVPHWRSLLKGASHAP